MVRIFLFTTLIQYTMITSVYSQEQPLNWNPDYNTELQKIESDQKSGKNKSAYNLATKVIDQSLETNNVPGLVHALNHLVGNAYYIEEEALQETISHLGQSQPKNPVIAAFLNSYLGEIISQYYERNRYRISPINSHAMPVDWQEMYRWAADQYESVIDSLYSASTKDPSSLQIPTGEAHHVLTGDTTELAVELRPRIYDLLQERYIRYLQNRRLHRDLLEFVPTEEEAEALTSLDLIDFLKKSIHPDHNFYRTIEAWHVWEQSLKGRSENVAYLDVTLNRLEFVYQTLPEKWKNKTLNTLEALAKKYPDLKNSLAIVNQQAGILMQQEKYKDALHLLEEAMKQRGSDGYPYYTQRARALIQQINEPWIMVQTEEAYPFRQYPLLSIQYKNLNQVQLELFPLTEAEFIKWQFSRQDTEELQSALQAGEGIWQKNFQLPSSSDYKNHRTETMIPQRLPRGAYALQFKSKKDSIDLSGYILFQVTDLTLAGTTGQSNSGMFVFNRNNGDLIQGAIVEMTTTEHSPVFRKKEVRILKESGDRYSFPPEKQSNVYYTVRHGNDRYISPTVYHRGHFPHDRKPFRRTVIFTDRAIYKPGDLIHFKAMTVLSRELTTELLIDQDITLALRDANGQEVWTKNYKTDRWGTVTGTATIPVSGLKGQWTLQATPSGASSVQVEAYVRPNFEIIVPEENISRDNNQISINGTVNTYNGFPVQEGQGTIEVNLEKRRWFYMAGAEEKTSVYQGTFTTDKEGRFTIRFDEVPLPDEPSSWKGFYFYNIQLSVQAGSGEIRQLEKQIPLNPDQVSITTQFADFHQYQNMPSIQFSVRNAMNVPVSEEVQWELSRLVAPDQYKVDRYWPLPDKPAINPVTFKQQQPHLFYNHTAAIKDWPVKEVIREWTATLKDKDSVDLKPMIPGSGYYRLKLISRKNDTLATLSFGVTGHHGNLKIVHEAIEIKADHDTAYPGQTVKIKIFKANNLKDGKIQLARPDGSIEEYKLSDQEEIPVLIREEDRGGIHVLVFGYLADRIFQESLTINVPWEQKKLTIDPLVKWDQLEVNTDTIMRLQVRDHNGEGIESEVGLVIYDASLDAYLPHDWNVGDLFFKNFNNPLFIQDLAGRTGILRDQENNIRKFYIKIHPLNIPALPEMYPGYGGPIYARRNIRYFGNTAVEMAAPDSQMKEMEGGEIKEDSAADKILGEETIVGKDIQYRENFEETLLFRGKLETNAEGFLEFPVKTNDQIGRWKVMVFAHSPEMQYAEQSFTFETTRKLYLESYLPEILRQGDSISLRYTVFNTTDQEQSGKVKWEIRSLFDAENPERTSSHQPFRIAGKSSVILTLPLQVPTDQNSPLTIRSIVTGQDGKVWDATEEGIIILPASETVVEGHVFVLHEGDQLTDEMWQKQIGAGENSTQIRIVQNMYSELLKSIPYLHLSNPTTTDQYFRNGSYALMGRYITNQLPGFENIYKEWKRKGELKSRLAQNEEWKYAALSSTPWVRQSESGTEQMALLELYFDDAHMQGLIQSNLEQWRESQSADGGFPWIKGGPSSFYITGNFLAELAKMDWAGISLEEQADGVIPSALEFVDREFQRSWNRKDSTENPRHYRQYLNYFHQRAYYPTEDTSDEWKSAWKQLKDSVYNHWSEYGPLQRAETGIAAFYAGDLKQSHEIVAAFIDNAIQDPDLGTYWPTPGQSGSSDYLRTLASISELLLLHSENKFTDGINQWVLVNKMTNDWQKNPHVFSLMLSLIKMKQEFTQGSTIRITHLGKENILKGIGDAGTIRWNASEGPFELKNIQGPPVWVGVISSHQVMPGEITQPAGDILQIRKEAISPEPGEVFRIGDRVVIRLRMETDRDLDYVYVEDPLIPGTDSGIQLSGFQWKQGLSYYQSFGQESVQFFIHHLPKGQYILEYELGVVREGSFTVPSTKIQSYFVPEITGYDPWKSELKIGE